MAWYYTAILVFGIMRYSNLEAYPTPVDFDGRILRWNIDETNPQVNYYVQGSTENSLFFRGLVELAASLWNDVPSSYVSLQETIVEGQEQIKVHFESHLESAPFSSGYATFDAKDEDGPKHCTIRISTSVQSTISLLKTILHELGHCLGLGHSLIPEAIMSYDFSKNAFATDLDDMAALTRLYPVGGHPKLPRGCGVGVLIQDSHIPLYFAFFFPLLLSIALAQRKRA